MSYRTSAGFLLASLVLSVVPASVYGTDSIERINARLNGTLLDFTQNHGCDRRIFSEALCECRDLYVYLPPNYDPNARYPLLVWLHSYTDDESEFAKHVAPIIDQAIESGDLPPLIAVAPDGSLSGHHRWFSLGSWYVNSRRGRYADFVIEDVVRFVDNHFATCTDPAGRAIAGFSMGGFGAFSLGLRHPDKFRVVSGISPALNPRHVGPGDDYLADFVPSVSYLRNDFRSGEVVGEYYGGLLKIQAWMVVKPVFGRGRDAVARVSANNPTELLDRLAVEPGRQHYYIGYGKIDEMNVDAQAESFIHAATQRGIHVESKSYPCGDHTLKFMLSALPDWFAWLKTHLHCPAAREVSASPPPFPLLTSFNRAIDTADSATLVLPRP